MKIVYYPEAYIQLRKVLVSGHEDIWSKVGWFMAFDQLRFIEEMNTLLGVLVLPEEGIEAGCEKYLKALEARPRYQPTGKPELRSILLLDHSGNKH